MGDTSKEMLDEALKDMFELIKNQKGDEKLNTIQKGIVPLYNLKNEELRIDNEAVDRYNKLEVEVDQFNADVSNKNQQLKDQRRDKFIENAIGAGVSLFGVIVQIVLCDKVMKFEDGGHTFTSVIAKSLIPKIVPKTK